MSLSFRPVFVLLSGRIVGLAATFLIPVILARIFSQEEFGTYKQVFLIYTTLYAIAQMGLAECLYFFLPNHPHSGGRYSANSMLVLLGVGVLCAILLSAFGDLLAQSMNNPELASYATLLGLFVALMLAASVLEITMIAKKEFRLASVSYLGFDVLRAALLVTPALFVASVSAVLWGAVAFAALRLLLTGIYLAKRYRDILRPDVRLLREQITWSLPFAAAIVVETAQANLHHYVVSYSFDAATFAIYSVACLQIPLVGYAASSAGDVLMVRMTESLRDNQPQEVIRAWWDATRKLALLFFPMVGFLVIAGGDVITLLFTGEYAASIPLFKLAAFGMALAILPTDAVLRVYGRTRTILGISTLHLAIVATLIAPFLMLFGLPGAILVTIVANIGAKSAAVVKIRSNIKTSWKGILPWSSLVRIALAALLGAGVAGVCRNAFSLTPVAGILVCGLSMGIPYTASIVMLGVLDPDELRAMKLWKSASRQKRFQG